jgi:hypothetical protein
MRRFIRKLADVMAAVAFAEEGETDTARRLLAEADREAQHERSDEQAGLVPPRHRPLAKSS